MKIFIVTNGTYSNYHISAVFSTRELALGYIYSNIENNDGYKVEEYDVDTENQTPYDRTLYSVLVFEDNTGEVVEDDYDQPSRFSFRGMENPVCLYLKVFAYDKQHAKKIASEYRARVIALKGWPTKEDIKKGNPGWFTLNKWMVGEDFAE